jgi:hypothetical protein
MTPPTTNRRATAQVVDHALVTPAVVKEEQP